MKSDAEREPLRRFGRYTLFEPVGRGGMAELFLAREETELGATKLVVLKLILPAFSGDPRFAEMLIHEAKLAAQLAHRHIVQVHELGRDEDHLYIAMDYVEGFDLSALLRLCTDKRVALPARHALGIVADVLEGLDYAHRRKSDSGAPLGIVHRDVSPSNILISYDGEVKLCDFGIAHANDVVREGGGEALKGKAGYMSPEHARGEALDARADVFAAGIVLWELLAGRRLYKVRDELPLLEQARRADVPPLPDKGLPDHDALQRIVSKALAPTLDDRYPSAAAFQRDLEDYLAAAGLLASRLELGEWLAESFGTTIIEERRASERRLPKSPPPRSSGAVQTQGAAESERVFAAPRVRPDLTVAITQEESVPLIPPPESPAGSTMDVRPLPSKPVSVDADAKKEPDADAKKEPDSDEEILAWAKRRGLVSLLFFFTIAVIIAVAWALTR